MAAEQRPSPVTPVPTPPPSPPIGSAPMDPKVSLAPASPPIASLNPAMAVQINLGEPPARPVTPVAPIYKSADAGGGESRSSE
jgi:hypothetical protein